MRAFEAYLSGKAAAAVRAFLEQKSAVFKMSPIVVVVDFA